MQVAFQQAYKSLSCNNFPVGCSIFNTKTGKIISKAYNKFESNGSRINHAEIMALQQIADIRSEMIDMYVTLRPCPMCAYAISLSRVNNLYIAVDDSKDNSFDIEQFYAQNFVVHKPNVYFGIMEAEGKKLYSKAALMMRTSNIGASI